MDGTEAACSPVSRHAVVVSLERDPCTLVVVVLLVSILADEMRRKLRETLGFRCCGGISTNKVGEEQQQQERERHRQTSTFTPPRR